MTEEKQETHEEEIACVRRYLASQAMRRTAEQLIEALREAHRQLVAATPGVSDAAFIGAVGRTRERSMMSLETS